MRHKRFKLACAALALSYVISTGPAALAAGIPTIDVAAIAQMVQQLMQMKQQYEQMLKDYEQLQEMTSKLEGVSGKGSLEIGEELVELFPELKDLDLSSISVANLPSGAQSIYNERDLGAACKTLVPASRKLCESSQALIALKEYSFNEAAKNTEKRIERIEKLIATIENSQTSKEIADLQARIQGELALIQVAQINTQLQKERIESVERAIQQQRKNEVKRFFFGSDESS